MFEQVGEKIKIWAAALFVVAVGASIIAAIVTWATIEEGEPFYVIGGFLIAIFGPLSAWLSSLVLYGFGELIETSQKQLRISSQLLTNSKKPEETVVSDELPEL